MLKAVYCVVDNENNYADVQIEIRPEGELELGSRDTEYRAVINQEMASYLWPLLKHFAETGKLPMPGSVVTLP